MKNDKFWDVCTQGTLRHKIAEFIDDNPAVSHLENEEYFNFEDALANFIYENREMIYREVDLEYQREDIISQANEIYDDKAEECLRAIPIEVIDKMISEWQNNLDNSDNYWDSHWEELDTVLTDAEFCPIVGIEDFDEYQVLIYAAYLSEWYSDPHHQSEHTMPASIEEFYDNEMCDEKIGNHYIKLASKLFGDKMTD